jgi:SOS-response transcriptional repressor LexA
MPTPVQAYTLKVISHYVLEHGYAPTGREIAAVIGTTRQYAQKAVRRLIAEGYLRSTGAKIRGIEVVKMIGGAS